MELLEKENKFITPDEKTRAEKKRTIYVFTALVSAFLALSIVILGSVYSFAKAVQEANDTGAQNSSDGSSAPLNVEISEEKLSKLEEFDANIKQIDKKIVKMSVEMTTLTKSPEDMIYYKELCDKQVRELKEKSILCLQYSKLCSDWAGETRDSISDSVAVYEEHYNYYKERLAANYEEGIPDISEILSTSENLIDFVAGKAMIDEIKVYDETLRTKVDELYSVVADGLEVVKYYLTKSEYYSELSSSAETKFLSVSQSSAERFSEIYKDKDLYNYYLQISSEQHQRFVQTLSEVLETYPEKSDSAVLYSWPVSENYYYTDYIGYGHENRYEWNALLDKYVNLFHSGVDIHTAGRPVEITALADGEVIYSDFCGLRGFSIALLHDDGVVTVFSSCSYLSVEVGEKVSAGDVIAYTGMSGDSDSFLLNIEVFENGEFVDPEKYISLPDVSLSDN